MARYDTFEYGDGTLYGAEAAPGATDVHLLWSVLVDWDGDGYFSGENEAENMVDFSLDRGRDHYISSDGLGFERYGVGRATLVLDNDDGRYNPFDTSSPLYPYVTPGKAVRISVLDRDTNIDHGLMRGRIADIQPYNQGNRRMVKIEVVDGQQFLAGRTVKIGYRTGTPYVASVSPADWTTGQWVDLILERAGWPEDEWPRTYDETEDKNGNQLGVSTTENFYRWLKYAWFWLRDANEAIRELENAELGTLLHARDGSARFLSSHFSYDQVVEIDESEILRDITTPQPWETIRNAIEIRVEYIHPADVAALIIWQIGGTDNDAIFVAGESSKTFEAEFRYGNFKVVPVSEFGITISWTFNAAKSGLGTDLSSQASVAISELGDGATLIFQNNGVSDGYIIDLSVEEVPTYSPYSTIVSAEDTSSQAIYGQRAFRLESPWLQEFAWADTLKAMLLNVLKSPTQYPVIKIEHRADIQFALDLYVDAIHLTADTLAINAFYRIGKIEHKWLNETGNSVLTTLGLEPYFALDAPAEIAADLYSPFTTSAEANCSGPAAAGFMEWCLEDPNPGFGWAFQASGGRTTGNVYCALNDAETVDAYTTGLSYTIPVGGALIFWYRWQDTDSDPADSEAISVTVETVETGQVYSEYIPFDNNPDVNEWHQYLIDLSDYAGETVDLIQFTRPVTFESLGTAIFRLDDVSLGKLIYAGDN